MNSLNFYGGDAEQFATLKDALKISTESLIMELNDIETELHGPLFSTSGNMSDVQALSKSVNRTKQELLRFLITSPPTN